LVSGTAEHSQVTCIPAGADEPFFDGILDRAAILVRVRAVRECAQGNERAELGKEAFDFFGNNIPELELSKPGRIDDPAAEIELDELRRSCGVPAFLGGLAHFAHA